MTTRSQNRLLGLTVVAFLATISGEVLGMALLVAIGVTSFFGALIGLLALMTATLVVGVNRTSGPDMRDPVLTDGAC